MRLVIALLMMFSSAPAFAAEQPIPLFAIDLAKSALKFIVVVNGEAVTGVFDNYAADVTFDPERLEQSKIVVRVQTGSAKLPKADMLKDLLGEGWLGATSFPEAVFESADIQRIPGTPNYYAKGNLTLKGKTLPVGINFIVEYQRGDVAVVNGYATLQRNEFSVGDGDWAKDEKVKFAVRVEFRVHARKIS